MDFKIFLTLTFLGSLLAGTMIGTLVEGSRSPELQGFLLGLGVWLILVGSAFGALSRSRP